MWNDDDHHCVLELDGLAFVQGSFWFFKEKCESSCFSFGLHLWIETAFLVFQVIVHYMPSFSPHCLSGVPDQIHNGFPTDLTGNQG